MRAIPAARARADHGVKFVGEIRKIEMAMAVDQHVASLRRRLLSAST